MEWLLKAANSGEMKRSDQNEDEYIRIIDGATAKDIFEGTALSATGVRSFRTSFSSICDRKPDTEEEDVENISEVSTDSCSSIASSLAARTRVNVDKLITTLDLFYTENNSADYR